MEPNLSKIVNMRISRTIENLKKNNMPAFYTPTKETALALLSSMLVEGETIGVGGSVTLAQIGAMDLVKNGKYRFIDRNSTALTEDEARRRRERGLPTDTAATPEEKKERQRAALTADTFIMSSNAITEGGCLYNVDGNGNRVSALIFGPKRVIVIAGFNKIVPDLASAVVRVKKIACPANTVRLDTGSFCEKNGHCIKDFCDPRELMALPAGLCGESICSNSVVSGFQRVKDRIHVIIVGEELGY